LVRHPQDPARRRLSSASPRSCRSSHAGPALRLCLSLLSPLSLLPPTSTSSLLHLTSFHLPSQATFPSSALDIDHHFPSQHAKTIFGLHDTHLVARQAVASPSSNAPCTLASPHHRHLVVANPSILSSRDTPTFPSFGQLSFTLPATPPTQRYLLDSSTALTQR
jgi:hypothetical protein